MDQIYYLMGVFAAFFAVIFIVTAIIGWKIFDKAGQPGWAALVPVYNSWILVTEICKKEPLWFILGIIPCTAPVAQWVLSAELAKKFGKSETFGIGLFLVSPVFAAILAFGDARYRGRTALDDYEDDEEEEETPRARSKKPRYNDDDEEDDLPPPKPRKPAPRPRRDDDY